ncbi:MAG TPA: hypothetical protein VE134_07370 [Methanomicrobiales archaeon]|nr:hypothetical protein [Methanomicrobiales archaeon]
MPQEEEIFHIRYTADFIVTAEDETEALDLANDAFIDLLGDENVELDEIFLIDVVDEILHVVEEEEEEGEEQ